jgi:hypothetical protein
MVKVGYLAFCNNEKHTSTKINGCVRVRLVLFGILDIKTMRYKFFFFFYPNLALSFGWLLRK